MLGSWLINIIIISISSIHRKLPAVNAVVCVLAASGLCVHSMLAY